MPEQEQQLARAVLMIRPVGFGSNPETAASNHFQTEASSGIGLLERARKEFDVLAKALQLAGVDVLVFEDSPEPRKPDAVFPNNWLTTHADGTVVLYPMLASNRRTERRQDVLADIGSCGFQITQVIDLSGRENEGAYLEGTGSMVLDRIHRVAYACRSPRTSESVLREFAQRMNYRPLMFEATDARGRAIYHTNVMLSIGRQFAVVCFESIADRDRDLVRRSLEATGRTIIEINLHQVGEFAGNVLELATSTGACVAMSARARTALSGPQLDLLEKLSGAIVSAAIPTIEQYGGGSVRCMLAEIHLPRTVTAIAQPC